MSPETFRWSWIPGLDFQLTEWDDEIVVFNRLTQDTHLFNRPVDWILSNTRMESLSFNKLAALAIRDNIMTDDRDSREALNQTLFCLESLNFLESNLIDDADTLSA
jgi:hypothetical protein